VFFPGVLLPGIVFTVLYLWPFIEARWTHESVEHHLLDHARDAPGRTAIGTAAFAFVAVMLLAGSSDVLATTFDMSVNTIIVVLRTALLVLPPVAALVALRVCRALQRRDARQEQAEQSDGGGPPDGGGPSDGDDTNREDPAVTVTGD